MKRRLLPFILGGALSVAAVAPAAAASINSPVGGLVNAIVQFEDSNVANVTITRSLNRLLQNAFQHADIDVLTNAVQNNLNNLDVDVTVQDIEVLENGNIQITLLGGDIITLAPAA